MQDGRFFAIAALASIFCLGYLISRVVSAGLCWFSKQKVWSEVISKTPDSVFFGYTDRHEAVHLKVDQRIMHTQIVGTTNAGKTESVILPWAVQDMVKGRGLIIIDGKSDRGILDKVYAYAKKVGREKDFKLFSLSHVEESSSYNPLIGGTCEEVSERFFSALDIDHPFYRAIQFETLLQILRILEVLKITPTFNRLHEAISDPTILDNHSKSLPPALFEWLKNFVGLSDRERIERVTGLTTAIGQFAFGNHGKLFQTERPDLSISDALSRGQILYFQLPVLLSPFLGKAIGKLVLQDLQSSIANRHRSKSKDVSFFSVFLDDFTEYLYPGFVSILNKSRSARVGVVFAHQALGDIEALGKPIANAILTNSNIKVFMRGSDPDSAEYFSRVIGTRTTLKMTERTRKSVIGQSGTGEASAREVEEFKIHPNKFKSSLGIGEGYVVIPFAKGTRTEFVKFRKLPDLDPVPIETLPLNRASSLREVLENIKPPKAETKRFKSIKFQE